MTYKQWLAEVDHHLFKRTGLEQENLPDWLSRDAYVSGLTPKQGADECLLQTRWEDTFCLDEA
jgi:hypothetical protein